MAGQSWNLSLGTSSGIRSRCLLEEVDPSCSCSNGSFWPRPPRALPPLPVRGTAELGGFASQETASTPGRSSLPVSGGRFPSII